MIRKKSNISQPSNRWMGIASGLVALMLVLSSCGLNFPSTTNRTSTALSEEDLVTPSVNVQFNVTIPAPLTEGQGIILQILDEVTGLPYNPKLYILSPISETQYSVTLPFQTGSDLKYRYVRIGSASEVPEATQTDGEVRYRMFHVSAESTVTDSVQMWLDSPLSGEMTSGQLSGQITSTENGSPLPDILVSAAGLLTFTDANGHFSLEGLSPGTQNIVFYAIDGA
ncbi:MAG: hypothetical protein H0S79_23550, partial [Anaerolineaceae bacterium]|nr:hypothetical protein [Anaerolineaceae bacterium]